MQSIKPRCPIDRPRAKVTRTKRRRQIQRTPQQLRRILILLIQMPRVATLRIPPEIRTLHCYHLLAGSTHSLFSSLSPAADAGYQIHLVAAADPAYLPADFEVWPIYHRTIVSALR